MFPVQEITTDIADVLNRQLNYNWELTKRTDFWLNSSRAFLNARSAPCKRANILRNWSTGSSKHPHTNTYFLILSTTIFITPQAKALDLVNNHFYHIPSQGARSCQQPFYYTPSQGARSCQQPLYHTPSQGQACYVIITPYHQTLIKYSSINEIQVMTNIRDQISEASFPYVP